MKTANPFFLVTAVASWMLTACDQDLPRASQQTDANAEQPYDDQLAATRDAYERQAAEMEARSAQLAQQLADLERSVKDQENKQLRDRLESVRAEKERLRVDAEAARRKSDEFEARMVRAPEPAEDYSIFYEELNPHGRWMEVEGYGYAWQPRQATSLNWRPYLDGRWVWSEHGWAWDSNEPFGWACYHYGRWMRLSRVGWVWVPGREWAPAWVSWRTGSDAVGWAPLPPERRRNVSHRVSHSSDVTYDLGPSSYTFINTQHFNRPSYTAVQMPQPNVTQIFQQTINVTNIVQSTQTTNVYVQQGGPRRDWIERFVRTRIPEARVEVVRQSDRGFRSAIEREHSAAQPHLTVFQLPDRPSKTRTRPPKVEQRVEKPAMVDGWAGVSPERRTVLREVVARQAREAPPATASTPPAPSDAPAPMPPEKPVSEPPATASRPQPSDAPPATPPAERAPKPGIRPGAPDIRTGIRTGRQPRPDVTERPVAPQPPSTTTPRTSTGSLPGSVPPATPQPAGETTTPPTPMPGAQTPESAVTGTTPGSSVPAPATTAPETPPPAAVAAPMPAPAAPESSIGQDGKSSTATSATDPVRPPAPATPQKSQASGKFKAPRVGQPPAIPSMKGRDERTSRVPPGMTKKGEEAVEARTAAARQAEELKQKEMEAAAKAKEAAEHEAAMKARAEAEAKQKEATEKAREEAMQKQKEMEAAKKGEEEARMKEEAAKKAEEEARKKEEEAAAKKAKEEEAARKQKEEEAARKTGEEPNKEQETVPQTDNAPAAPEAKPATGPGRPLPRKLRKGG